MVLLLFWCWLLSTSCVLAQDVESPWMFPKSIDYPSVKKTGKRAADFVPHGWKIMGQASGDLNNDGNKDIILVIKDNRGKFKQKNTGLGDEIFDTNPRILLILFCDPQTHEYKLAEESKTIISIPESPTVAEPFKDVSIHNGIFQLNFTIWYSAGSWSASDISYKFHWQDKKFVLIGANKTEIDRGSGKEIDYSYNFLTRKEKITTGNFQNNARKTRWEILKDRPLKPLSSFKHLYEWQVALDEYL